VNDSRNWGKRAERGDALDPVWNRCYQTTNTVVAIVTEIAQGYSDQREASVQAAMDLTEEAPVPGAPQGHTARAIPPETWDEHQRLSFGRCPNRS